MINHYHVVRFHLLVLSFLLIFVFSHSSFASDEPYIPEVLQPWAEWVLHDKEEQLNCVPQYDRSEIIHCTYPSEIELAFDDNGGEFRQVWLVHHTTRVSLPGNPHNWPLNVKVNGESPILTQKNKLPRIELGSGYHIVSGNFVWNKLPEHLQLPPATALVSLTVNGDQIPFPSLDASGRLWLKNKKAEEKIENRLKLESYRLIDDEIPAQVVLYLILDVAGAARELTLGPLYNPDEFIPLSLSTSLPAKLEQSGEMRIQVRPGRYTISLNLRHEGPLREMAFNPPKSGLWPQEEIWSFRAQPDIRLVEIGGVHAIDPLQTSLPKNWQSYPAYRIVSGGTMQFKEVKRGDPEPAPDQLNLHRSLWLRFDGSGYSIQDRISGKKNTNWRLEIDPSLTLGRVAVDGAERIITKREVSDKVGVELRNGLVELTADSVHDSEISHLPATGWDHDFQKVSGRLFLPPGWKLLHANGIDNISKTWVKRWTLLDFFIVLIFTIALAKLFSKPLAGVAFITLVLTYHEPDAPRYIWLALLVGFTLLRYLPDGKFKIIVKIYQYIVALILLVVVIPYAIQALRIGFYPQLAKPWTSMTEYSMRQEAASRPAPPQKSLMTDMEIKQMESVPDSLSKARTYAGIKSRKTGVSGYAGRDYAPQVIQYDPKALTQTGPGMPKWPAFETIAFSWAGPVVRDQMVSWYLIGPRINLVLAFVRVFLITVLALGMFGIGYRKGSGFLFRPINNLVLFSLLLFVLLAPRQSLAGDIPSSQMLSQLQGRLLEKDDCFPSCADISRVDITINSSLLVIEAQIDAELKSAIPVPGHVQHWLPQSILINGTQAEGLMRGDSTLWLVVPKGRHKVELRGAIRKQNTLQLPFPLRPHLLNIASEGWSVEGMHSDGSFDAQLQFKRVVDEESTQAEILETGILPAFASVERTFLLGLVWKIQTRVKRLSPNGSAIVMDIPLIKGESVITEGIRVKDGTAKINLRANQSQLVWESFLQPAETLLLQHEKTKGWRESWKVDISPIYHLNYEGIPVIFHKTGTRWYPTWYPWPGEEVVLNISRPAGIEGQTLTIEKSHLVLKPGRKSTAAHVTLFIKSSQGGQHTLILPQNAILQEVKVKGKIQPIRQDGRRVALPIHPGQEKFELKWLEPQGMSTKYLSSEIDLGIPSVNASVDIQLSHNRWPLFVGGEQLVGPAVLFWSVIIIIVLMAFGLSKTGLTPLKFYQWLLLGIGISMSSLFVGLVVAGWLICLDLREKADTFEGNRFNVIQVVLAVVTGAALASLVYAVSQGLLGHPDMNIVGNGSHSTLLRWYHDSSENVLPKAWVISIPMFCYRIAMLLWALWVSFWLVSILKWGWRNYTSPAIWKKGPSRPRKKDRVKKSRITDEGIKEEKGGTG